MLKTAVLTLHARKLHGIALLPYYAFRVGYHNDIELARLSKVHHAEIVFIIHGRVCRVTSAP